MLETEHFAQLLFIFISKPQCKTLPVSYTHLDVYKRQPHDHPKVASLDFVGSLIFVSGSVLIVAGLTEGGESWRRPVAYVPFSIGVLLFCSFFIWNCYYQKMVSRLKAVGFNTPQYLNNVQVLVPKDVLFMPNFIPIILSFACNNACLFSVIYLSLIHI